MFLHRAGLLHRAYCRVAGMPVAYAPRRYRALLRACHAAGAASDAAASLRARWDALRDASGLPEDLDRLLPRVFALVRDACSQVLGLQPFDEQLMAAAALHDGRMVQLATGEGKTLAAVFPAILNARRGAGVHILTANDYLARRDAEWMGPVYECFGLSAASVIQGMAAEERRAAYRADVTYVTAKEAGFDFLRDQRVTAPANRVLRPFHFAIVDEADFILIDEARVPLVLAGTSPGPDIDHLRMAALARQFTPGIHYVLDEYERSLSLTDAGLRASEHGLQCGPLHTEAHAGLLAAIHVALHAEVLLKRDRDYIVRGDRVELVDEFTGRVVENRRWPHGIQPALEAKEHVSIRPDGLILGSIPIQHLIRLWPKLAGMTATAEPAAEELETFYGLKTVVLPPHRPCIRHDEPDVIFTHGDAKHAAIVAEVERVHGTGRPVLVGTPSVRESEALGHALRMRGVRCRVLNARHDAREARIIARAGMPGAVTIATNMAGRGTDIVLGGGDPKARERVVALGGLYVIGTSRHESRRVDDQLRGRAGRQGDPGTSRFFVSLDDDLVRRYGVVDLIPARRRPAPQPSPVADPVVRRALERAQRIIDSQHFEMRRTLWRYASMVEEQRRETADRRSDILTGAVVLSDCRAAHPDHYAHLVRTVGAAPVEEAERLLALAFLDRRWSAHLAHIEDIREGIHLQRYAGRDPLTEFQRQIIAAYAAMLEGLRDDVVQSFERLRIEGGCLDMRPAGIDAPGSTWTYLINDNPTASFGLSLIAPGNFGLSLGAAFLAVAYWPITAAAVPLVFVRRWLRRRHRRSPRPIVTHTAAEPDNEGRH